MPGEDIEKEVVLGDTKFKVVIQTDIGLWDDGDTYLTNTYQFYSTGEESKLITELESQLFHSRDDTYKPDEAPYFSLKDITGDGVPEIFILWERNASNLSVYRILTLLDGSLMDMVISGGREEIDFDDISYQDGLVYASWHGSDGSTGTTTYRVSGRSLRPVIASEELEKAAKALQQYASKGDAVIDSIIESYYDMTLYYGNYSDHNIFRLAGENEYQEFFAPYFTIPWPDEAGSSPQYEAFRIAFFDKNGSAWNFEFPWPTGAALGGNVIDRKLLDPSTMLVYANYGVQGHLGPAGEMCKQEGEVIDRWIFKKIDGEWKVSEIEEGIDHWETAVRSDTQKECVSVNEGKLENYRINE